MTYGLRHWTIAIAVALAVHAAVLLRLQQPESGAEARGRGGVEVALRMAGRAPGAKAVSASEETREPAEAQPVEANATLVANPVKPESVTPEEPKVASVKTVRPQTMEEVTSKRPIARKQPKKPPKSRAQPQRKATPPSHQSSPQEPKEVEARQPPESTPSDTHPKPQRRQAPSNTGAGGRSGSQAQGGQSGGSGAHSGGGRPGEVQDYLARVRAYLQRFKAYPRRARLQRQEGTALVRFTIDATGQILAHEIDRSAGYPLLDRQVLAMLRKADPLPPVPKGMERDRLELVIPVSFHLR